MKQYKERRKTMVTAALGVLGALAAWAGMLAYDSLN